MARQDFWSHADLATFNMKQFITKSKGETIRLAEKIARNLKPGSVIALVPTFFMLNVAVTGSATSGIVGVNTNGITTSIPGSTVNGSTLL